MKRLRQKLKNGRGLTLVEMVAAAAVLALLGLMLHTGLFMAQNSYNKITGEAESQLLLSTLTDLLSNELRYARDVVTGEGGASPALHQRQLRPQHHPGPQRERAAGGR